MWNDVPMRRKDRLMPEDEADALLLRGEYGVLASADAAGRPLATPLNYVMMDGALYFHCAGMGQKMENLAARREVCFCVVGKTQPVYDGDFSTYYESAMVFGAAALVRDEAEKRRVLTALVEKYLPEHMDKAPEGIEASFARTSVVRIDVERVSGKAKKPKATP